ncbi:hypothetical protein PR048_030562 [Dryococelus australis]|uniref:Uncharacterized protein n=1 Tax=Dryococelus australis TaxID=614101 RepID=A0ABQ9G9D2_9NEOP|nr:hypothetical protein PR048_030562 [Dryococelus australis]
MKGVGQTGDPRENPPTSGIVWHDAPASRHHAQTTSTAGLHSHRRPAVWITTSDIHDACQQGCAPCTSATLFPNKYLIAASKDLVGSTVEWLCMFWRKGMGARSRPATTLHNTVQLVRYSPPRLIKNADKSRELECFRWQRVPSGLTFIINTSVPKERAVATVFERLSCSPPTKTTRVQSLAWSLRIFICGNRAGRCHQSAGFFGVLPFPQPLDSGAAPYSPYSPSSARKTSIRAHVNKSVVLRNIALICSHDPLHSTLPSEEQHTPFRVCIFTYSATEL